MHKFQPPGANCSLYGTEACAPQLFTCAKSLKLSCLTFPAQCDQVSMSFFVPSSDYRLRLAGHVNYSAPRRQVSFMKVYSDTQQRHVTLPAGYEKSHSLNSIAGLRPSPAPTPFGSPGSVRRPRSPIPSIL
ncbi:hypothetical protein JRQ81_005700 [Phrynocephalus forsythii]|uniref:Uncharacterized protein n=1 Tax=Phrynocephalus forsythii TaxID=171643 RepID=A0A9Q0XGL4_9SAUR|nr:hypothetical protein JRQ81_005700 [Phrynocephalus forsythii]